MKLFFKISSADHLYKEKLPRQSHERNSSATAWKEQLGNRCIVWAGNILPTPANCSAKARRYPSPAQRAG